MEDISNLPDFFEAYPEAEAIEVFRNLKSKRENAGAILYYIKFMNDPSYEHLRLMKPEDRKEELKKWLGVSEKDLCNTQGNYYNYIIKCEEWYKQHWLDPTARLLLAHTNKIFDAERVVNEYSIDSIDSLPLYEKAIGTFQTIKDLHDKALAMFKSTTVAKEKRGGGDVSVASTGEIFHEF